jgi:UDP-N-acetylmuramoyl-L-alanyl-D-glutamate--2,6-diaminopimelate ligase
LTLNELVEGLDIKGFRGDMDTEIKGVSHDSRRVSPGDLFVALRGGSFDGLDFISDALDRGAVAVMSEAVRAGEKSPSTFVGVADPRTALAYVSNRFYRSPSDVLQVIGVTGTNGKTTTTRIIRSILETDGNRTGLIGTINYMVGDIMEEAGYTTPEPVEFQRLLRRMLDAGCTHAVSEVSSHALSQKRVDFTRFRLAVFTNLTRDHLDFHGDMEDYFSSKRRLFDELLSGPAVINADDPYGARLLGSFRGEALSYGMGNEAELRAEDIRMTPGGLDFTILYRGGSHRVVSPLIGRPNVYNILSAAGACLALGVSWDSVLDGIGSVKVVEGRFEKLDCGQDFLCIVDYAHTDDALRRLILSARELTGGRVITVFGCGGGRDRGKRQKMGASATELSDLVFITSDNPRGEDPEGIINEIVAGAERDNYRVVPDRAEAIKEAVMAGGPSDTVLVAGKGHEECQEVMGRRLRFSDREVTAAAIMDKTGGGC